MKENIILEIYGISMDVEQVMYIHVIDKEVHYFLKSGEVIKQNKRVRINTMSAMLRPYKFIKINKEYVLNKKYLKQNYGTSVILKNSVELQVDEECKIVDSL